MNCDGRMGLQENRCAEQQYTAVGPSSACLSQGRSGCLIGASYLSYCVFKDSYWPVKVQ